MSVQEFARTPRPPYYVVNFTSLRRPGDNGYGAMADRMEKLAARQPGYLGIESARGADGFGITNSYWADEDAIRNWKAVLDHIDAQRQGRETWYEHYHVRVAKVERAYEFIRGGATNSWSAAL